MPLVQPRLDSVEEWRFVNYNNDEHPIHVHVNDFQVTEYYDPTTGLRTGADKFSIDNANAPAPTMQIDETVIEPGILSIRTRFDDYIGLFVMHCHRLNHEDNGLMALINVIPAISSYAVAVPGAPGKAAQVRVHDGNGDRLLATVTPFPGYEGSVSVAMGDVDDDGVYDLLVGAGKDHAPEVVVYSGKARNGRNAFATELARFRPFAAEARGGVSVAAAQIDGTSADNIIVGSGPGIASEVRVYSSKLPSSPGTAPALFATFSPYAGDRSGVSLATGFVDFATGRHSIVTAPGPGVPAEVKVFAFSLFKPINNRGGHAAGHTGVHAAGPSQPANTASFKPFGDAYRGGVSLATGWLAGSLGGAKRIVVSQLAGPGTVKVFSSGSALDEGPALYLHSPNEHDHAPAFREIASFNPFDGDIRHTRRHHEHDHRRRPAGQRRGRAGPERERHEVRVRQAARAGDDAASPASRRSLFRSRLAAGHARRRLTTAPGGSRHKRGSLRARKPNKIGVLLISKKVRPAPGEEPAAREPGLGTGRGGDVTGSRSS